jgi:hypothetical protein
MQSQQEIYTPFEIGSTGRSIVVGLFVESNLEINIQAGKREGRRSVSPRTFTISPPSILMHTIGTSGSSWKNFVTWFSSCSMSADGNLI